MTTKSSGPGDSRLALQEIPNWLCLCVLAAFTLSMLAQVLFVHTGEILSDGRMDLAHFFVHWRYFGFHEMRSGHLALWNPHCYCGEPFFGNFQSALLYPLNFPYLLLPLAAAVNWTIALHVFLGGAFTFYWARNRGLHSLACLLSGLMFMFCGPHFLQIQTGHLPNLCTLIWAPLLFLCIDKWLDRPAPIPCLVGMFTVGMSILAGHPQYVFYMGVVAGIYAALNLAHHPRRGKAIAGLGGMLAGGICLSAVQLFTGLDEGRESMRSLGMSFGFASSFSFPPENFLTLLAPWCFGDGKDVEYWGRWYVTESSLFIGVMGLALAVCGIVQGPRTTKRFSTTMVVIALVLAMGGYTPLFHLLFDFVPGFNLFRGMDKFLWLAALFLSLLAGLGMDQILRGRETPRWLMGGTAGLGIALLALSCLPRQVNWWSGMLEKIHADEGRILPGAFYAFPDFIAETRHQFSHSMVEGAVVLFIATLFFALAKSRRPLACGCMLLMTAIELTCFARHSLTTFDMHAAYAPAVVKLLKEHPGDYRVAGSNPNSAMTAGTLDIGGDDPSGLLRYVRYLNFTEGFRFDANPYGLPPKKINLQAWKMLRCQYYISDAEGTCAILPDTLPRLLLVDRFRVTTNYREIFPMLTNASFAVDKEVVLESPPEPAPLPAREKGSAKLVEASTDSLTIEADTKTPALLLVTDAYSSGWRAQSLPGSSQARYEIMPANYCLRAVPLAAGHHLFRMEYSPLGFRVGKVVSLVAWPVFLILAGLAVKFKNPNAA